jgi:class 3 adenylate cyclase
MPRTHSHLRDLHLRDYLRRPDRSFWLELLKPLPAGTEIDQQRRVRLARYALGAAFMVTLLYVLLSTMVLPQGLPILLSNLAGTICYSFGMWAASLGSHRAARMWLMATLAGQMAALVFLTGATIISNTYLIVMAVLARILFSENEKGYRCVFIGVPMALLLFNVSGVRPGLLDFSALAPPLLVALRIFNNMAAAICLLVLFDVFNRQVLGSESSLVDERNRSERLLYAVLPRKIADELRASEKVVASRHAQVTVLFADVAGFTPWAAQQDPEFVVSLLENIFHRFDQLVKATGAEKIKTIGDAYMAVSGAPDPCHDHAHVIAGLALNMLAEVVKVREQTGIALDLRIGVHTGPVIAGVIGAMRFTYDIWGDTVNTASRMESHGEPGRIQLSAETRELIEDRYVLESRGAIEVKGKGAMQTWWLVGEK